MSLRKLAACACALLLVCLAAASAGAVQPGPAEVEFVTAQELKAKIARNERVTVIDVRATNSYADSNGQIRGAIHVKSRRLRARLALPPLSNVPRDSEVVTYCACPNDEASIRAAQTLSAAGFKRVRVLKGGWRAWLDAGGQVESKLQGL